MLRDPVPQGVPRNPEKVRGSRDVPAGTPERLQEPHALEPAERGAQRVRLLRRRRPGLGQVGPGGHREAQCGACDDALVREQSRPLNQVRELADVARPRVRAERGPGVGAQGLGREPIVGARADEERFGEQDDVATPLPERRQRDGQDGEAVVEGLEEPLCPHGGLEVDARRRDDPGLSRLAPRAAETPDRALLDCCEKLRLEGRR